MLILGVGSFAQSTARILRDDGARVAVYLTRDYGHYAPSLVGPVVTREQAATPMGMIAERGVGLVIPMSIDWAQAAWHRELVGSGVPIFGPTGEGMRIERERDFARGLCETYGISFPRSFVARNRLEAEEIVGRHPMGYVLKNPLCSPTSPIHTILCESVSDTRSWIRHVDYAEGVFLQEYLGPCEAGHIALVSGGEIYSMVTNQEYKRAFAGNLGIVAGAPMGGLVEKDPGDKYGLARALIEPLRPWFREVGYHGPIQVTAVRRDERWYVIEYNIRIGVTSGAMMLRMLENPTEVLMGTATDRRLGPRFVEGMNFGCSVTLAGYGYPYVQLVGPRLPVELTGEPAGDLWWNEVALDGAGGLVTTGHRIADVIAFGRDLPEAVAGAYADVKLLRSLGSYYRPDVGASLWPPGSR